MKGRTIKHVITACEATGVISAGSHYGVCYHTYGTRGLRYLSLSLHQSQDYGQQILLWIGLVFMNFDETGPGGKSTSLDL